jgi:hypothetical protein
MKKGNGFNDRVGKSGAKRAGKRRKRGFAQWGDDKK